MRKKLIELAKAKVLIRLEESEKAMKAAQNAANEETKSSAGDKYETGRAMAHNDLNLFKRQWHEAKLDWDILESINTDKPYNLASSGAIVKTSIGIFFLAVSIGIIDLDGQRIMVTSIESPMGSAIYGKKKGESVDFRNQQIKILEIS